jgi:hypothetical protein
MPRMLDLIRDSAVPANLMRSAALGALALPAMEMVEILVYLTRHPVFREQARLTLAEWDETSGRAIVADHAAPREVLDYFLAPDNRRMTLVPALLDNPSIGDRTMCEMAAAAHDELASAMLKSCRVRENSDALRALRNNATLSTDTLKMVDDAIQKLPQPSEEDILAIEALSKFEIEHKDEIAAEGHKPFKLYVVDGDGPDELADLLPHAQATAAAAPAPAHAKPADHERVTTLQKIARMSVGERIQLAMKGSKDERFILVRDGSKLVCCAVLESPKLSDSEVEGFAGMKNVQEIVLRTIAMKRRFMKHYAVIRQLANNPRTPLDVALGMLPHLIAQDLKYLSLNKNVSDTVRKLASKLHRDKQSGR